MTDLGPQFPQEDNPRRLLQKVVEQFPDQFWHMNARLLVLRQDAKALLSNPEASKDEMRRLYAAIGHNRQNETGQVAHEAHAKAVADGVTHPDEITARIREAKMLHLKAALENMTGGR